MELSNLLHNPVVIGSLGLSAGSIIGYFRNAPKAATNLFERLFTCSIQVSNMDCDDTYSLVRNWVSTLDYARKTRNTTGVLKDSKWILTPAPGNHFFWFEGRPVWLHRDRDKASSDVKNMRLQFQETITLRMMTRNKAAIERLCDQIREFSRTLEIPDGSMRIFTCRYSSWESAGIKVARPLDSVVLPKGQMERIRTDLETFWASEERYKALGVPYRRGWLLQGSPGSGKTSLVSALAGHYKRDVYIMNLADDDLNDTKLLSLAAWIKSGSILLLEDIDAAFSNRDANNAKGITFSGLLNALDGVVSPHNIVVVMTTNHPEKLDPALIRPGRVDQVMDFGPATDEQLATLYKRFTGGQHPEGFVQFFRGKTVAQAQVELLKMKAA